MTPYYDDGQMRLYQGDVRDVLRELPAGSVQTVVTSPPYWSLRDYGVPPSVWGGDDGCEHEWTDTEAREAYTGTARWQHTNNGRGEFQPDAEKLLRDPITRENRPEVWGEVRQGAFCARCGAWRGALGLEPTPDLFVAHTVEVFREVRRVLADDGTLWLNIGDSYASGGGAHVQGTKGFAAGREHSQGALVSAADVGFRGTRSTRPDSKSASNAGSFIEGPNRYAQPGLKAKDLVGIPWMLAFALRADGWWLRQEIIWSKPNPMPESVTDRCTKAHESLFLLAKAERYYYDQDAIREADSGHGAGNGFAGRQGESERCGPLSGGVGTVEPWEPGRGRNKRSVWTIPTAPFPEAHFATFPPALVEPCILAGSRPGDTVLDPFVGSGTTAMVARRLGRRAVGIDLNPDYLAMAVRRCGQMSLDLAGVS